ncbi:MAG TPA: enoyl-CoA hydratase-related protein [Steroidobacteraceae bacterium]|jgi:methylglutaconyl-CoA hydratase|nr:enoyl-CoA hydratase-related protein [Steroidobacteraceae bacterium]
MAIYQHIEVEQRGAARWLWLNRPDVRNAFNDVLVADISAAFADIEASAETRVVVLAARGNVFSAGADLNYMRAMAGFSHADNQCDALKVARMFHAVHSCSRPVIARVHGQAFGGGVGLVAACDIAVAKQGVIFGLSEVKLGLVAATISPHLVRAMGARRAARFMLTAENFTATQAQEAGLVHEVTSPEGLDAEIDRLVQCLLAGSPAAIAATKRLLADVIEAPMDDVLLAATAKCIAEARASPEGRAGVEAFLAKRQPAWSPDK